jgi:hypothetical protein
MMTIPRILNALDGVFTINKVSAYVLGTVCLVVAGVCRAKDGIKSLIYAYGGTN